MTLPENSLTPLERGGQLTSHGACGKTWKQRGNRSGHCARCHETFEGLALFDWHQVFDSKGGVICRNPDDPVWKDKGLRLVEGSWRGPKLPDGVFGRGGAA